MAVLNPQQRRLGLIEFGIGVPANVVFALALYFRILPEYPGLDTAPERVVFALQCAALPGLTMVVALFAVALGRSTSAAIDPFAGAESRALQVHMRFLSNTTEQLLLYVVSSVALSAFLDGPAMRIIPVAAVLFFVNRFVFWIGYLIHPDYRGAGLSGTLYPVTAMMIAAAVFAARLIFFGGG